MNHKARIAALFALPLTLLVISGLLLPPDRGLHMVNSESGDSSPTEAWASYEDPASEASVGSPLPGGESALMDDDLLSERVRDLESVVPLNSLLISQGGELIVEEYFSGMQAGRAHNVKSVSKSILSILVGIAIDHGYLEGVDQTIEPFFPEYFESNADSEKAAITIGDLLTMRSGLASTSGRNYGRWVLSRNWVHHALDRPLEGRPGRDRIYSTGTTHLLGVVISRASGMNLREFANRYLFGPMEMSIGGWDRDPQGFYLGGNNMALRPVDMIKLGRLMMNTGSYQGEQIVSKEWVVRSVQPVTGRGSTNNYGYLWFRRMADGYHVVYAWGNGGQFIKIVPELDTVMAITSREFAGATRSDRFDLFASLDNEIIPYLQARSR